MDPVLEPDGPRARVPLHGRLLVAIVVSVPWMLCQGALLFSLFLAAALGAWPWLSPVVILIAVAAGVAVAHSAVALTGVFVPQVSGLRPSVVGAASAVGALAGFMLIGSALDRIVHSRHEALAHGASAFLGSSLCAFVGTMARRKID